MHFLLRFFAFKVNFDLKATLHCTYSAWAKARWGKELDSIPFSLWLPWMYKVHTLHPFILVLHIHPILMRVIFWLGSVNPLFMIGWILVCAIAQVHNSLMFLLIWCSNRDWGKNIECCYSLCCWCKSNLQFVARVDYQMHEWIASSEMFRWWFFLHFKYTMQCFKIT